MLERLIIQGKNESQKWSGGQSEIAERDSFAPGFSI
jgi:hypothetical protein